MSSFAIYRLPHAEHCTLIEQVAETPVQLQALSDLSGLSGFVAAPFCITPDCPLLLIRPDRQVSMTVNGLRETLPHFEKELVCSFISSENQRDTNSRDNYSCDFERFHAQLREGRFQKLVLARCASVPVQRMNATVPLQLFLKACELYPRLFISLVSTPQSGTWLAATPEILLEGCDGHWRTIALAGTMKLMGPALSFDMPPTAASPRGSSPICWSTKNVQEQHYVATYLSEQLRPFVCDLHEEGPCTVRAANLVHLRSDFTFTLLNNARVGDVLQALHPTPAVCGLPKDEAFDFILHHEHTPRQYYSGFLGPLNIPATTQQPTPATHLYVSLRCMQITATHYRLYAGGGLLKDSQEEQEWAETEAKMETMRHCIG